MSETTWKDPIVEEVRAARRALAEAAGFDLHRLCEEARRREASMPEKMASGVRHPKDDARRSPSGEGQ